MFGNFKETRESSIENIEKPKNQILELPDKYCNEEFNKKLDINEAKENKEKELSIEKNESDSQEKSSFFDKVKSLILKEEKKCDDNFEKEETNIKDEITSHQKFTDSIKIENSDNHIEKQAIENNKKQDATDETFNEDDSEMDEENNISRNVEQKSDDDRDF